MKTNGNKPRLGIDIGGTFTDLALQVGSRVFTHKLLTTPTAPEQAVLQGIDNILHQCARPIDAIGMIIHGTTLATNALIERRGAHTAFVTTAGFRDVVEMRAENRFEQYDLNMVLPPALVARRHRYTVTERIGADGEVLLPLDPAELTALAARIAAGGYDSVAVGLLHSYANTSHEQAVRAALLARLPQLSISLSFEVSPQVREYARFSTVCANAYVKPMLQRYLHHLRASLNARGATCPVYMMHSGGGLMSLESASEFPVRLMESGPAGGAMFAAEVAARHSLDKVVSFDMGGTTAKICLIKAFKPRTARSFEVARSYRFKKGSGLPLSIPVLEMVEIGAGGGSLAQVDDLQQLRVGPQSAGAEPGPACYSRGGEQATVTDAELVLGRLHPERFADGSISLSQRKAEQALQRAVGDKLATDARRSAVGVIEVVDENMANAARMHAIENGEDLSTYSLVAFGGAAPLHAGRLCEKLGIKRLLVPHGAGVGSAIGFLKAPFSFEAVQSFYQRWSRVDLGQVRKVVEQLHAAAEKFVAAATAQPTQAEYKAFMRYVGQGWEIPVAFTAPQLFAPHALPAAFEQQYKNLFGRSVEQLDIEVTSWSVRVSSVVAAVETVGAPPTKRARPATAHRRVYDTRTQTELVAAVFARAELCPGDWLQGAAIVQEAATAVYLPPQFELITAADGCLLIQRQT